MTAQNVGNPATKSNLDYALTALRRRGLNPIEQSDGQWLSRCPTHEDRTPSLSVTERDGKLLVKCHAGCDPVPLLKLLTRPREARSARRGKGIPQELPAGTRYVYEDERRNEAFVVLRQDSPKGKKITQWTPAGGAGLYLPKALKGQRPLYGLPDLLKAEGGVTVFEGEKCADAARLAWPASAASITTYSGGGGNWKHTDWKPLEGRTVRLVADSDAPGRKAMTGLAGHLAGLGCSVELALPEGSSKADVVDWIAEKGADGALDFMRSLLQDYSPPAPVEPDRAADGDGERLEGESSFQYARDMAELMPGRFLYEEAGQWYEAGPTSWRRCVFDVIERTALDVVVPGMLKPLMGGAGDSKRIAFMVQGAWRHPGIGQGFRSAFSGILPPAPLGSIPTPDGIYTPTREGVGKPATFDPEQHGYRAVTASQLPGAEAEGDSLRFFELVDEWCGEDAKLAAWLQCLLGAAMIGQVHRKVLNVIGPAGCGKTTFTRLLSTALGPLAQVSNERLFDPRANHNAQVVELIELQPRLTFLQESQGKRIDADLLNQISGGEKMTERRPYAREDVTGVVTTLPVILGEAPPSLYGTTGGTLERLKVCPFVKPKNINPDLIERAKDPASAEARSALLWLLEGASEFLKKGGIGDTPSAALMATETAQAGYDEVAAWLNQETEGGTGSELLGKMQKDGVDTGKSTASTISRRARKLGFTDAKTERSSAKRPRLIPPTRAR